MAEERLAAILAGLSLAGDLGHGEALEHSLRTAHLAVRLAERLGLGSDERRDAFYVGLLRSVGCVGNAHEIATERHTDDIAFKRDIAPANFLGPADQLRVVARHFGSTAPAPLRPLVLAAAMTDPSAARRSTAAHCETGALIARRAGLSERVAFGLMAAFERWDGRGLPRALAGPNIPLAARVVAVAAAAVTFQSRAGEAAAATRLDEIAGKALDPELAGALLELIRRDSLWRALDAPTLWEDTLGLEPAPRLTTATVALDELALAFADFADVKSPWFVGHSRGVGSLASEAARALSLGDADIALIRRAGLLHDVGRASVPNPVLDKAGPLTPGEREQVRLHAYYTERVLERAGALAACASLAAAHHERLDGSGYYRGRRASAIPVAARIIAAADVLQAVTERRAYRPARPPEQAASVVRQEARAGHLDAEVVEAVISAAGGEPRRVRASAILTERELEIVRLLAAGQANKEIARQLRISESTARHHLENVYAKLDVSTRTGAVMQALSRGLL